MRGVRQGDPLSPLLFVLAAGFLQSILNKAMNLGILSAPLQVNSCPDFPVIQYADDTLVLMPANARQLICLKALLNSFAPATGLKVNYAKSFLVPNNIEEDRVQIFTNTMNCARGQFPFTYLGLPLGLQKPTVEQCLPIVSKVAKLLVGLATFMTQAGKILLVKSVLASLPIFFMCCLDSPITIKKQIIKYLRHCLWTSPDLEDRRPAMVAWSTVCRPKDQGGLGIMDIYVQNKALLMKNLHKFFNRHDIPWVNLIWETYYSNGHMPGEQQVGSFWWRANLALIDQYKAIARCNVGDGKSALFWKDLWHFNILKIKFPLLFTFVINPQASVHQVINAEYIEDMFHLPLTTQAHEEFLHMEAICLEVKHSEFLDMTDTWSYIWGNEFYSSTKAYKVLIGHKQVPQHFN
jgi:hypothetical protein